MSARFSRIATTLFVVAFLSGCSLFDEVWHSDDVFTGAYAWGFEASDFRECDATEKWWVSTKSTEVSEELINTYLGITGGEWYREVHVKVRGRRSVRGQYGHLGVYTRELTVESVLEMRALEEGEC